MLTSPQNACDEPAQYGFWSNFYEDPCSGGVNGFDLCNKLHLAFEMLTEQLANGRNLYGIGRSRNVRSHDYLRRTDIRTLDSCTDCLRGRRHRGRMKRRSDRQTFGSDAPF